MSFGSWVSHTSVAPQLIEGSLVPQCCPTSEQLEPRAGHGAPASSIRTPASAEGAPQTGTPQVRYQVGGDTPPELDDPPSPPLAPLEPEAAPDDPPLVE